MKVTAGLGAVPWRDLYGKEERVASGQWPTKNENLPTTTYVILEAGLPSAEP